MKWLKANLMHVVLCSLFVFGAMYIEVPWWQRWIVNPINWVIDAFSGGSIYDSQVPPAQDTPATPPPCCNG